MEQSADELFGMDDIWKEIVEAENKLMAEAVRINNRISKAISNQFGSQAIKDINFAAQEAEVNGEWEIVRHTRGKFQEEDGYEFFTGYWVDQWSVGDSGDSFNGHIYIKLKEGRWLKMFYSC